MTRKVSYSPRGVCSTRFDLSATDGMISGVAIEGGCEGNLKAVAALLEGMRVADAVGRLRGITCGGKGTSCPDQLAAALGALL